MQNNWRKNVPLPQRHFVPLSFSRYEKLHLNRDYDKYNNNYNIILYT